jgi:hypothetical protein
MRKCDAIREAAMKLSPSHPRPVLAAIVFALSLLVAPVAQAFTLESPGGAGTGGDGAARVAEPDSPASRFGTIGPSNGATIRQGNTTFQFGGAQQGGSFNQRYDSNRLFDPLARDR